MTPRITVLCNTRFPSTAAHGAYLARLSESFAAEGAAVELVVPRRWKELPEDPLRYYGVRTPFAVVKIGSFDFLRWGRVLSGAAFFLQNLNFYLFVAAYFLFRSRDRIIYTMDNLGCGLALFGYRVVFESHVGVGPYRRRLLPLLRRASAFVVTNGIIRKEFAAAGFPEDKILVAQNGVDLSFFDDGRSKAELRRELGLPEAADIIAYVGAYKTMGMQKGVDQLVRGFRRILEGNRRAHLLVVGLAEGDRPELERIREEAGIPESRATFVRHVPQRLVAAYMRSADALLMNYPRTDHYSYYMSPMKMFEYMASGVPIVASDLPAIREVLDPAAAIIIRPDDEESLVAGIGRALSEREFARKLAAAARKRAEQFTWKARAEKILRFLGAR